MVFIKLYYLIIFLLLFYLPLMSTENMVDSEIMSKENIYDFEVIDIDQNTYKLERYKGNVIIIVNSASKCGLAEKSFNELSAILDAYENKGLRILLFPCGQFMGQEYDRKEEIISAASKYNKNFIIMNPIEVKGNKMHPLFKFLTKKLPGLITNTIKWNFTYFLVDKNGIPVKRYSPTENMTVDDKHLKKCIEEK